MEGKESISELAQLLKDVGMGNFVVFIFGITFLVASPILLTWLKESLKRKSEKQIYSLLRELTDKITILVNQYNENISLPACESAVYMACNNAMLEISCFIRDIIINNNIDSERASIENRIQMIINNQFKANDAHLAKFKYKGVSIAILINESWKTDIYKVVIRTIYDCQLNPPKKCKHIHDYLNIEFDNIFHTTIKKLEKF